MPTTNPVPSTDPSDLLFNAGKLDEVVNGTANSFTDRLGVARRTVAGMNADFDAQLADAESDLNVYRSDAAASAAEALGYLQTIRATSYGAYASDPTTDPLGNPPTVGDEYFNTTANLLKRWNGTTWQASDINTANLAASSGSSLVGYDGGTVQDVLDGAKSLQDYAALRAYTGRANRIYITGLLVTAKPAGIAGVFQYDQADTTSADNGGTIIVGADGRRWKRQFIGAVHVKWFGAKGNWNAYEATGDDDSAALQQCFDFIASTEQNVRAGGERFVHIDSGHYRIKELNISRGIGGFGIQISGDGETSQIWCDPTGNGVSIDFEYTQCKDVVFNGKLSADLVAPAIPYIFRFKKHDKAFDIDATFINCRVQWFDTFARVAGRGFNFKMGSVGQGNVLCEIAMDSDLVVPTGVWHTLETKEAARHYVFSNSRTDGVGNIFKVTGTHAAKEYINGINIFDNEYTGMNYLVYGTDCRLVQPSFTNNSVISGFTNAAPWGVVNVPRVINLKDIGNRWNNYIGDELPSTDPLAGIPVLYRIGEYIDGFKMLGTTAKNVYSSILQVGYGAGAVNKKVHNVSISDCTLPGFGDVAGTNGGIIQFNDAADLNSKLKNIKIKDNDIQSNSPKYCYWLNQSMVGLTGFEIIGNSYNALFGDEQIAFTPQFLVSGVVSADLTAPQKTARYKVEGSYVIAEVISTLSTTLTSGFLSLSLPVPAVAALPTASSVHSGTGSVENTGGLSTAQPIFVRVEAGTVQQSKLLQNGAEVNLSSKTSQNMFVHMVFKYKFK